MEPTEEQYLVLNALETLELLINRVYDENNGIWFIQTPSPILPIARLLQSGDIVPVEPESEV